MYAADVVVKSSPVKSYHYKASDENANPVLGAFIAIIVISIVLLLVGTAVYFIQGQFSLDLWFIYLSLKSRGISRFHQRVWQ